ncbi:STAGA complex 65 subunit gamma-like [Ylistrum balloti]|uniref:STAGA complex 65 subunit gamma-like n=1 Tax=Ylistrum balloti TaxID=509963 RepID=UPI002905F0C6|nr:STAGA complex 65 subunit gamma-like [Ylistrum balloti]
MTSSSYWGELPSLPDTDSGIAAIEREQMTKPRPMDVEGPRLHQPSSRHHPPTNDPLPSEKFEMDPIVMHTIRLVQHAKKLRQLISSVQQQQEAVKNGESEITYPVTPPIPEFTGSGPKHKVQGPVPFMPKEMESDFVKGIGEPPPEIDDLACRKLLRRSVSAVCAHTGYDSTNESILETLTDITHEYFQQLTTHLCTAVDNRLLQGYNSFPDVVEEVFHQMGIGSVTTLHSFYQSHIINYQKNMEQTCQQLVTEYEKMKLPTMIKMETVPVIRIKEEPCSEIQFPVLDENDEINDAEQLLQLEGLSGFEITVEHESTSGLTTEMDSKWQGVKSEAAEGGTNSRLSFDVFDEPGSVKPPRTPAQLSEGGDSITDPASIPGSDIMSPPSITSRPSKPKKRKK